MDSSSTALPAPRPTPWRLPVVVLASATVVVGLYVFGRLGDGSFDCPDNVIGLYRHPLREHTQPFEGFDTARACNRAARERIAALPVVVTVAAVAVALSVLVTWLRRRRARAAVPLGS